MHDENRRSYSFNCHAPGALNTANYPNQLPHYPFG
jgi:hypothetical protein